MSNENWQKLVEKNLGLTAALGKIILSAKPPFSLPDAEHLLVASDYGGAHRSSAYDVYTALIVDASSCAPWLDTRANIRAQFLSQNRRMSYKALNDGQKRRALGPFLAAANQISGICASFAISKAAGTIFQADDQAHSPDLSECFEWPKPLFERTLRIVHIVSFFIAGLSRPNQDVLWFSDEDEIAASPKRLSFLTKVWANVLSNYAIHSFRHLRCGTTACDDGTNSIEDLVAIPDLVAGAVSDLLTSVEGRIRTKVITPFPMNSKPKAVLIGQWLSTQVGPLQKIILVIDKERNSDQLTVSKIGFNDLTSELSVR